MDVTAGYRIRLAAVLLGLVALQALYLALIALVMYLTAAYMAYLMSAELSLNLLTITIYVGPVACGLIATLFLLKPIIIRPRREPEPPVIDPDSEPLLFEFVERLCRIIGAPRPYRIRVDLAPNASAAVDESVGIVSLGGKAGTGK
ncbi:MAG: hypothetical protein ABI823_18345, partial [Bryobacteraceae bacterium]